MSSRKGVAPFEGDSSQGDFIDDEVAAPGERTPFAGYWIDRRLTVGGMCEVFLGHPKSDPEGDPVVIKRLLPHLLEEKAHREGLLLEAKLHGAAFHPAIVRFIEAGQYAGEPYLALEYVRGLTLSRLLRSLSDRGVRMALGPALRILLDLLSALRVVHDLADEHGHRLGVVHRDVTPSNILLSENGACKLTDFGIASVLSSNSEAVSFNPKGKYAYLSPELVTGESFDHRADLFSAAVVFCEILLGTSLFSGTSQLAVLLAIRDGRLDGLLPLKAELPASLFGHIARALSKDPEQRFASAAEFLEALRPFAGREAAHRAALADEVHRARIILREAEVSAKKERSDPVAAPVHHAATSGTCLVRPAHAEATPVTLTKLIEMLATGQLGRRDEVDLGSGFAPLGETAALKRYLPSEGPASPRASSAQLSLDLSKQSAVVALRWIVEHQATAVIVADGVDHTMLSFEKGKLVHASSSEPSTLLGERLIQSGTLTRSQLDTAVCAMHAYSGQLGDTLIGLRMVSPVDVFRHLREQGRERVTHLLDWKEGSLLVYETEGADVPNFRLDLDIPGLLLASATRRVTEENLDLFCYAKQDATLIRHSAPKWAPQVMWPASMVAVLRGITPGIKVHGLLTSLASSDLTPSMRSRGVAFSRLDIVRAMSACVELGVVSCESPGPKTPSTKK